MNAVIRFRFISIYFVYFLSFFDQINKIILLMLTRKPLRNRFKHQYEKFNQNQTCCICGMGKCDQAIDHQKITIPQLSQLIASKLSHRTQITQIKQKISEIYKEIKRNLLIELQRDEYQMMKHLNKFYFPTKSFHMHKADVEMISQIIEQNIEKLPDKRILKLKKKIQRASKSEGDSDFDLLKQKSQKFLQDFKLEGIILSLRANLPFLSFKEGDQDLKRASKTCFDKRISPEQADWLESNKNYEWRNVRITKKSRTVSLSNKNISDREVMEQIPIISNYLNLKQFEIRNNKISCFSCNMIANNMPFLLSVDIRGNKIGDKGIIKLIRGIPKLKSLFVSETLATDESGKEVADRAPDLEMFWSQHTRITNVIALRISEKPKLKILSLIGNPIDDEYKEKMKKIFISKGYISI